MTPPTDDYRRAGHRGRHLRSAGVAVAVVAAFVLSACSGSAAPTEPTDPTDPTAADAGAVSGDLTVFAAASLAGAFDELATAFETAHPAVDVVPITYDGSSVLATQLREGAVADVFASADEPNMAKVVEAGLATGSTPFATNVLQIAVAPGNPLGITGLDSIADGATTTPDGRPASVVLCAPEVPCGTASNTLVTNAGLTVTPVSEEQNVTAVLQKVESGEADAGLVYVTDVTAAGDGVTGIEIDGADAATNVYPITALSGAPNPAAATAFVEFVASPDGQRVLADHGFGAP